MKHSVLRIASPLALAAGLALVAPQSLSADVLVDNFQNTDPASEGDRPWGGSATWRNARNNPPGGVDGWKNGYAGRVNKLRSIDDTTPGINDAYNLAIVDNSARYNHHTEDTGGGITNSGATNPENAFQQLGFQILREDADFDAEPYNYLRLTAWLDDDSTAAPTPNPLKPDDARFVVTIGQFPEVGTLFGFAPASQPAKNVMGPHDGSDLGLELTNEPTVYILPIKDTDVFKVDEDLEAFTVTAWNNALGNPTLTSLALDDWQEIRILGFHYLVKGAPAQTGSLNVSFAIDDIMFLENEPGLSFSVDPLIIDEGGDSEDVDVVLDAMPSHDVTLDFPDTADLEFSPN